jgi:amino acid transporter
MATKMQTSLLLMSFFIGYRAAKDGHKWSDIPMYWQIIIIIILAVFVATDLRDYYVAAGQKNNK